MDIITQLGPLALASRLRRLSERLMRDASRVYHEQGVAFEPPWFPITYLLSKQKKLPVTVIARELGITHPAVNQIARQMMRRGLLAAGKDSTDDRRRLLSLSPKGRRLLAALQPIWEETEAAARDLIAGTGADLLSTMTEIECALDRRPMYDRVTGRLKRRHYDAVEIVDYRASYKRFFRELNYEWLTRYFAIEPVDEALLADPRGKIIKPGGDVFFARLRQEIVGTAALIKIDDATFELAKMAVTERVQGRQIGRRLADAAIARAREKTARTIILHTSPKLVAAANLYRSLGFVVVPSDPAAAHYSRCTITMRLDLTTNHSTT